MHFSHLSFLGLKVYFIQINFHRELSETYDTTLRRVYKPLLDFFLAYHGKSFDYYKRNKKNL